MADLTIKPQAGSSNKLILQDQQGGAVLTTATSGATLANITTITGDTTTTGNFTPTVDNSKDLGSATKRWRNIYTTDLHLNNDRGDWTVIEEEEYLSLRNNKNGKMYKFVLEEIE
tara:strand:+ start:154 stop:498 length:345 start_codon:yes stop_codon:yes gene_type:complete